MGVLGNDALLLEGIRSTECVAAIATLGVSAIGLRVALVFLIVFPSRCFFSPLLPSPSPISRALPSPALVARSFLLTNL